MLVLDKIQSDALTIEVIEAILLYLLFLSGVARRFRGFSSRLHVREALVVIGSRRLP